MISHNPNFKEYTDTVCPNQVILETICPWCGKKQKLVFNDERAIAYKQGKIAYEAGKQIQEAFPSFSPDEREFMMTGICPKCWESM